MCTHVGVTLRKLQLVQFLAFASTSSVLVCNKASQSTLSSSLVKSIYTLYPRNDAESLYDKNAGLNAQIPLNAAPFFSPNSNVDIHADYVLTVDPASPNLAFSNLDSAHTVWTALSFVSSSTAATLVACVVAGVNTSLSVCASDAFMGLTSSSMSSTAPMFHVLAGAPLTVASNSFLLSQQSLTPDLIFDASLVQSASTPTGNLVRTTLPGSRDMGWGFVLNGCALPYVTIRLR